MTRFLVRRILQSVLTLFLLLTAVFFFIQIIIPGDFVGNMAMFLSPEQMASMRDELGLNVPIWQQYLQYMGNLARLDLGNAYSGQPVIGVITGVAPKTVLVFVTGLAAAFVIGQHLGRVTAWRGSTPLTDATAFTTIAFYAFFPPALAYLMRVFLGDRLGIFPEDLELFVFVFERQFGVRPDTFIPEVVNTLLIVAVGTIVISVVVSRVFKWHISPLWYLPIMFGLWLGSWAVLGIFEPAFQVLRWAGIPIIAFMLLSTGEIMVITRTSMADTLHEQYVETAKAKGLKDVVVRDKHAARNALLPVLSKLIISLPYLLGGLAIIEFAVNWQGMGTALFRAVDNQDIPIVLGFMVVIGILTLVCRIFLEVLYAALDPRIRRAA